MYALRHGIGNNGLGGHTMKNLYEELDTLCLRCECRGDLKCGPVFHCKTYNNLHDALRLLEKLAKDKKKEIERKLP